ncbi:MAG: hypothetical protein IH984_04780 [Planctomycetes bacterium]|nr:hypothetical protein [Planctomycetota bacterium]
MQDSRSKLDRNGWKDGAQSLAPEIRAARMLLSPASQEEISQLAEDMEVTLSGNQPARAAHSQHGRRGIALWLAVSIGGIISLVLAGSTGWASAIKYHSIAEKNIMIADQEQQMAAYFENQAATERKLREDLQVRDERLKYIANSQLKIIAGLRKSGHYAKAISMIDLLTEITVALDNREGDLIERISQERIEMIIAVITDVHDSEADLSGVRTELEKLSTIKKQQPE